MRVILPSGSRILKLTAFVALAMVLAGLTIVYFSAFKWVTIYIDDAIHRRVTFAQSVEEVLDELGCELRNEDYVYPPRQDMLQRIAGIAVVKAQPYTIIHDGQESTVWSVATKVADVLTGAGIEWHEEDVILPPLESPASQGQDIAVVRVASEIVQEEVILPHSALMVPNSSLYRGQERVAQVGADGKLVKTIQITYHDNEAVDEAIIDSEVVVEARDGVVEYGTISSISRGGYNIGISHVLDVRATAYCAGTTGSDCPLDKFGYSQCTGKYNNGYTSTGRRAKQGKGTREDPYIIAVDRSRIPLNSLVYLAFPGGGVTTRHGRIITDGFAIAADVGSAIQGNRIDILFDNHWVAWYFGNRSVRVFVVESVNATE